MEALALRLYHLDSQAEGALRVVMFYDTLMRRRVDLPALARASADPAKCAAGIACIPRVTVPAERSAASADQPSASRPVGSTALVERRRRACV